MERPLLAVKQMIPPSRPGAVRRERLHRRLRLAETRLTVVVAPAGWGKTSLLSGWAADPAEERRVAWVSLDEDDDEPSRFWTYVLGALHRAGLSAEPLEALGVSGTSAVDLALPLLLNELAAAPARHVLVLDDYHVLADPRIHEALEYLLAYLPPALRVVVAGRADPPLPVARLRSRGELTELRADDLRFSVDEAVSLVASVSGTGMDPAAASSAWKDTEGWAAGLQLSALAMRAGPGHRNGQRHVLDYFTAEVLPGLAPEQRDLLVRSAPLERLSGPLCDAALDVGGSAQVLDALVRADLFVTPLDADQQWYRCHHLLRDVLGRQPGNDPATVLERAAAWFVAQDRLDDAAGHLLRAGRVDAAVQLLEQHAESWFVARGLAAELRRLGVQLSDDVVGPVLAWHLAYAAGLCGDRPRVIHWLGLAEATATADTAVPGWHSFRAAVLSMRSNFGMTDAEAVGTIELAREAVELETADGAEGHPTVRPMLGTALARDGRFADAADYLLDLWDRRPGGPWPSWLQLVVAGTGSVCLIESGRLADCDRVLRAAAPLAAAVVADGAEASNPGLPALRLAEGRRRHQRGEAGAAERLREAVAITERHPRPSLLARGLTYLADAELARGDRRAAHAALARCREVVDTEPVSAFAVRFLEEAEQRIGRGSARSAARSGALVEELTDRELSVLRALQGTASQREIGSALFLSINTVKAYTKSLYRKLGVSCRSDAVVEARELGLI